MFYHYSNMGTSTPVNSTLYTNVVQILACTSLPGDTVCISSSHERLGPRLFKVGCTNNALDHVCLQFPNFIQSPSRFPEPLRNVYPRVR